MRRGPTKTAFRPSGSALAERRRYVSRIGVITAERDTGERDRDGNPVEEPADGWWYGSVRILTAALFRAFPTPDGKELR